MASRPLLSVVMPAYNAQKYIAVAIESILHQTFKRFELIIINDSSTDRTARIVRSYARRDPRIRLVNHKGTRSIARVLNYGIAKARTNIIARMDADDIALPERLAMQYKVLTGKKRTAVVGANIAIVNEKGKPIGIRKYPTTSKALKRRMFRYSPFAHPVVMFKKDLFDLVGGYNPIYSPTEDLDLWFRLGAQYSFQSIPTVLLQYRVYQKSTSHSMIKALEMLVFQIRWEAFTKYGFRPGLYDIFYNVFQFATLWVTPARLRIAIYNVLRNNDLI